MMKDSVRIPLDLAIELSSWLLVLKQDRRNAPIDAAHHELVVWVRRSHPDVAKDLEENWMELVQNK
jgi:hypothetical protein